MMAAIPPALVLGSLFCIGYAALWHLWIGRTGRELWVSLLMAFMGFGFGQAIGFLTAAPLWQIGQLHLLEASLGAWLLMGVARLIGP
jgi:hypothetical protein